MTKQIEKLSAQLQSAYNDFSQYIAQLSVAQQSQRGVCGDWSPKEVVAHLAGWDAAMTQFITDLDNFEPPINIDQFNAQSVAARQHLSWQEGVADLEESFAQLQQALKLVNPTMPQYDRTVSWLSGRIADYEFHTDFSMDG